MAKKITIPYNGKTYTLEYTRATAKMTEKQGFRLNELDSMPLTMVTILFNGAFLVHHPNLKGEIKEKIYDGLKNRSGLVQVLAEMYVDAYNSLFDAEDEDDEGNSGWGVME